MANHADNPDRAMVGVSARRIALPLIFPAESTLVGGQTAELALSAFAEQIVAAGGYPVPLSWDLPASEAIDALDALVLTGGEDIDQRRSGAPTAEDVDTRRDEIELALFAAALDRGLPVFGVCRGMQLINVALGGTLGRAAPLHDRRTRPFADPCHEIETTPGSIAERLYGDSAIVNSVHRQRVEDLAPDLEAVARAADGTIEAIADPSRPIFGVQWHPEYEAKPDPAFTWLLARELQPARS